MIDRIIVEANLLWYSWVHFECREVHHHKLYQNNVSRIGDKLSLSPRSGMSPLCVKFLSIRMIPTWCIEIEVVCFTVLPRSAICWPQKTITAPRRAFLSAWGGCGSFPQPTPWNPLLCQYIEPLSPQTRVMMPLTKSSRHFEWASLSRINDLPF